MVIVAQVVAVDSQWDYGLVVKLLRNAPFFVVGFPRLVQVTSGGFSWWLGEAETLGHSSPELQGDGAGGAVRGARPRGSHVRGGAR